MVAAAQHHGGSAGTTELSGWRRLLSLRRRPCNSSPQISPPTVRPWTLPPALATTASASKSLMACSRHQDQRRSIIGIIACCKNICAAKKVVICL
ncbi:hypothetical protein BS78_K182700 [Paspalum vaginatum]|uniref:Uncharacterized protein n=1 Tax=Paspalum vaginatum TaxID=158149 RepID=A0A9W8CD49_9POAL|nr:hypothetical protein BS78_K182700 [Paspalum vaginatum]KAJ1253795.1 hypothetical protein BS78_K182700 [Paspalum vaginatum]